jgi:hypothetical protein
MQQVGNFHGWTYGQKFGTGDTRKPLRVSDAAVSFGCWTAHYCMRGWLVECMDGWASVGTLFALAFGASFDAGGGRRGGLLNELM